MKKVKPKSINGKFVSGSILVEMCKAYVQTINQGQMPNIENAWNYVCKSECNKALLTAIGEFDKNVSNM